MTTARKNTGRIPPSLDVPLLTEVVEGADEPAGSSAPAPVAALDEAALNTILTERITALTDRLLQDAAGQFETLLIDRVREKLKEEIPALIAVALRENRKE